MIAAELADFDHGGDRSKGPNGDLKISQAAQALNVGERTVKRARAPTWRLHLATGESCGLPPGQEARPFLADARQAGVVRRTARR